MTNAQSISSDDNKNSENSYNKEISKDDGSDRPLVVVMENAFFSKINTDNKTPEQICKEKIDLINQSLSNPADKLNDKKSEKERKRLLKEMKSNIKLQLKSKKGS
ncbi:MAG: hypothetical protein A3H98_03875 [Bacteroidetes bacterium RIFCSPLOWO2_02_FULL_36_8]|nr:MAG: hypothetical protein A3H98_03875 [Bacteroidetes bacterium RIFCSPLOWO2_02_FULL_36_8]